MTTYNSQNFHDVSAVYFTSPEPINENAPDDSTWTAEIIVVAAGVKTSITVYFGEGNKGDVRLVNSKEMP